ncbi:hypothetical protein V8F06_014698 [Rhypophila decipiens]
MFLRRKPGFLRESVLTPAKAMPPVYLKRSPLSDYKPVGVVSSGGIGLYRPPLSGQLAVVQEIKEMDLKHFRVFCDLAHQNIIRPLAIYYDELVHIVCEYVELSLLDILPLSTEIEVASIMSQLYDAITTLISHSVKFRIKTIRISVRGIIKLVLDWEYEPRIDREPRVATYELISIYLRGIMATIGDSIEWSDDAIQFQETLHSGCLPQASHKFLAKSEGRIALTRRVSLVSRIKLSRGEP